MALQKLRQGQEITQSWLNELLDKVQGLEQDHAQALKDKETAESQLAQFEVKLATLTDEYNRKIAAIPSLMEILAKYADIASGSEIVFANADTYSQGPQEPDRIIVDINNSKIVAVSGGNKKLLSVVQPDAPDNFRPGTNGTWEVYKDIEGTMTWVDTGVSCVGHDGAKGEQGIPGKQGERGPIGATGSQGLQGIQGNSGKTPVIDIVYADDSNGTNATRTNESGKPYIGIKVYYDTDTQQTIASKPYIYSQFKGAAFYPYVDDRDGKLYFSSTYMPNLNTGYTIKGERGPKGADGTSVIIKEDAEACTTVGDAYIDTNGHLQLLIAVPDTFRDCGEIKGPQGPQGEQGPEGTRGTNISFLNQSASGLGTPSSQTFKVGDLGITTDWYLMKVIQKDNELAWDYANGGDQASSLLKTISTGSGTSVGSSINPVYVSNNTVLASSSTVGSTTEPVYLNGGTITKGSKYAGATSITLNDYSKAGSAVSFYALDSEEAASGADDQPLSEWSLPIFRKKNVGTLFKPNYKYRMSHFQSTFYHRYIVSMRIPVQGTPTYYYTIIRKGSSSLKSGDTVETFINCLQSGECMILQEFISAGNIFKPSECDSNGIKVYNNSTGSVIQNSSTITIEQSALHPLFPTYRVLFGE